MNPRTLLIAVAGLSLLGCGGGAGQGGAFTTSVSGGIRLNGLSSAQAAQLCNDVNNANAARLEPTSCGSVNAGAALLSTDAYLRGNPTATDADLRTQCSYSLTALAAATNGCLVAASCDAALIVTSSSDCMATVADVVNCINENDALAKKLLSDTPTCDAVTASSLSAFLAPGGPFETENVVSTSASCEALAACNGISTISTTPPPGS